jgi:hypothetical protein
VELSASDLAADLVEAGPLAVSSDGTSLTAGGEVPGGWWSPWLAKIDASGELLWRASLAGKPDTDVLVHDVAVLPSGVSVVAAGFGGTGKSLAESRAGTGVLTAFSSEGEELWSLESEAGESVEALLVDTDGHVVTLGTYPFVEPLYMCEPEDLTCERRALVLRTFDESGIEIWSRRYELGANEPPRFRQPSLMRGAWVDGKLLVLGWNYSGAQPWLGSIAY